MKEVLGVARYGALRSPYSGDIELIAIGTLPCRNYRAKLVQRAQTVLPPEWDMVFVTQDICVTAVRPFEATVSMAGAGATEVVVHDSTGVVRVQVTDPFVPTSELPDTANPNLFDVYSLLSSEEAQNFGCIVIPHGSLVPAIYKHVYGAASFTDCNKWMTENC